MASAKDQSRVAAFLARGPVAVEPASDGTSLALVGPTGSRLSARRETVEAMAAEGLLERRGARLALVRQDDRPSFNIAESPLTLLASRRTKDGKPFLTRREFDAGERLRRDYTRGRIMPRLGANWEAAGASGRRGGDAGGIADLTDAALSARQRVDLAIGAVGPELSGVLIDICCFLKAWSGSRWSADGRFARLRSC